MPLLVSPFSVKVWNHCEFSVCGGGDCLVWLLRLLPYFSAVLGVTWRTTSILASFSHMVYPGRRLVYSQDNSARNMSCLNTSLSLLLVWSTLFKCEIFLPFTTKYTNVHTYKIMSFVFVWIVLFWQINK